MIETRCAAPIPEREAQIEARIKILQELETRARDCAVQAETIERAFLGPKDADKGITGMTAAPPFVIFAMDMLMKSIEESLERIRLSQNSIQEDLGSFYSKATTPNACMPLRDGDGRAWPTRPC